MKIKIFSGDDIYEIQKRTNYFLKTHKIEIIKILQNITENLLILTIFYKEVKNESDN